jgi:hypothetical protein
MRREQDRKLAVEALGLKHADMIVGRTKRHKERETQESKGKSKDREEGVENKEWGYQTSLKGKLPEYITFVWSCRVMHFYC